MNHHSPLKEDFHFRKTHLKYSHHNERVKELTTKETLSASHVLYLAKTYWSHVFLTDEELFYVPKGVSPLFDLELS